MLNPPSSHAIRSHEQILTLSEMELFVLLGEYGVGAFERKALIPRVKPALQEQIELTAAAEIAVETSEAADGEQPIAVEEVEELAVQPEENSQDEEKPAAKTQGTHDEEARASLAAVRIEPRCILPARVQIMMRSAFIIEPEITAMCEPRVFVCLSGSRPYC